MTHGVAFAMSPKELDTHRPINASFLRAMPGVGRSIQPRQDPFARGRWIKVSSGQEDEYFFEGGSGG